MVLRTLLRLMRHRRKVMHSGRILSSEPIAHRLDGTIMALQFKEAPRHQIHCCGKDRPKWDKAIQLILRSGVTMKNLSPMESSSNHWVIAGSYQLPQLLLSRHIAYTDSFTIKNITRMVHLGSSSG